MKMHIDINCDMGESYGSYVVGNDEAPINIAPLLNQQGFKDMILVNLYDIRVKVDTALADV